MAGTELLLLLGMLFIIYLKIMNIKTRSEEKPAIKYLLETGLCFLFFLFLIIGNLAAIQAGNEQPFYEGEIFETSQYVLLGSFLLIPIMGLTVLEILFSLKLVGSRERLKA